MGYRIALTVEELGELAAAITKAKPIEEVAEEWPTSSSCLWGTASRWKST